jgi:hypothetical protein
MNLLMVIAVCAAISKELGLPLRFPGTEAAYRALYQVTSADILASAAAWAGETPLAANEIFNITSTIKARRAGFPDCIDTEDMFSQHFDNLREMRVIPSVPA